MPKIVESRTLAQIKALAKMSNRLVYGMQSCWWKVGSLIYTHHIGSLPCGPSGEMLLETDNPMGFIAAAENSVDHYGKHGLKAFVAAYHGNLLDDNGTPTSFKTWQEYNDLIDKQLSEPFGDDFKGEIARKIYVPIYNNPSLLKHQSGLTKLTREIADRIVAVIEGHRCVWIGDGTSYKSSCGNTFLATQRWSHCQGCGRRIEVKDAT